MKIDIVIPTLNRREKLVNCLNSIFISARHIPVNLYIYFSIQEELEYIKNLVGFVEGIHLKMVKDYRVPKFWNDHLKDIDYVHNLLDVIKDQEVEQERALSQGTRAIKKDSLTVKEIVLVLSLNGQKTLNYLSRSLQLSEDVLKVYAKYMVAKRIAHSHTTHRGSKTLLLVKKK